VMQMRSVVMNPRPASLTLFAIDCGRRFARRNVLAEVSNDTVSEASWPDFLIRLLTRTDALECAYRELRYSAEITPISVYLTSQILKGCYRDAATAVV